MQGLIRRYPGASGVAMRRVGLFRAAQRPCRIGLLLFLKPTRAASLPVRLQVRHRTVLALALHSPSRLEAYRSSLFFFRPQARNRRQRQHRGGSACIRDVGRWISFHELSFRVTPSTPPPPPSSTGPSPPPHAPPVHRVSSLERRLLPPVIRGLRLAIRLVAAGGRYTTSASYVLWQTWMSHLRGLIVVASSASSLSARLGISTLLILRAMPAPVTSVQVV